MSLWDNWGDERGCDEGHWHADTRELSWGLPEDAGTVQQVHYSRRRLLQRELEFHMFTINKSVHTKKKAGNWFNDPRTATLNQGNYFFHNLLVSVQSSSPLNAPFSFLYIFCYIFRKILENKKKLNKLEIRSFSVNYLLSVVNCLKLFQLICLTFFRYSILCTEISWVLIIVSRTVVSCPCWLKCTVINDDYVKILCLS